MKVIKSIPLVAPSISPHTAQRVAEQISSGMLGPGQQAEAFAKSLSQYAAIPFCALTVSGTVALSIAARALGLQVGDEILVPAYGVISTINAFASFGFSPRLVEINRKTGSLDPNKLENSISAKTKAVCFVDFSGYVGEDLLAVKSICKKHGIPLIEDAACALGQCYDGKFSGSFGDIGIYSFSVPKIVTTGQGGALLSDDQALYEKAVDFMDQGDANWRKTNLNYGVGSNLRFNDVLAVLGQCQLDTIEERLSSHKLVFSTLKESLGSKLFSFSEDQAPLHNIVFTKQASDLVAYLSEHGIQAVRQYRTISQHPAYADLRCAEFQNSDFWTDHAVYLPFGMSLRPDDAQHIADVLSKSRIELVDL